jgi:hypothetical protein
VGIVGNVTTLTLNANMELTYSVLSMVFPKGRSRICSLLWASRNVTIKSRQYRVIDVGMTPLWHLTFRRILCTCRNCQVRKWQCCHFWYMS